MYQFTEHPVYMFSNYTSTFPIPFHSSGADWPRISYYFLRGAFPPPRRPAPPVPSAPLSFSRSFLQGSICVLGTPLFQRSRRFAFSFPRPRAEPTFTFQHPAPAIYLTGALENSCHPFAELQLIARSSTERLPSFVVALNSSALDNCGLQSGFGYLDSSGSRRSDGNDDGNVVRPLVLLIFR